MWNVPLDDGRIIPIDFRIHHNKYRKLIRADQWAIKWADRLCRTLPKYSVAIATRQKAVAWGSGENEGKAIAAAGTMLDAVRISRTTPIPSKSVAAALNFTPDLWEANMLRGYGVDVIFLLQQFDTNRQAGGEMAFIDGLIYRRLMPRDKDGKEQHFFPHTILVQPPWKAKSWE